MQQEKARDNASPEKIPFETLIRGEYREDFQKKVEEILRKRFKNQEKQEKSEKKSEKQEENQESPEKAESKAEAAPETEAAPEPEAGAEQARDPRYVRLVQSAQAARRAYPGFDLRKELASPQFVNMVLRGVDAKTAYEAVHHEEMLRAAMGYGVRQASEKLSRAQVSGRPAENGAESQSVAVDKTDPRHMTAEQRAEIRRRVLERGEKVWF